MTLTLNASNAYLSGTIDLTASPQLLLTNSSTYTVASILSAVTAEEVSENGFRIEFVPDIIYISEE